MKVYKLVCIQSRSGGNLSAPQIGSKFVSVCGGEYSLDYSIEKKTVPVIGRLFGFDKIENAMKTLKSGGFGAAILEGEATDVKRTLRMAYFGFFKVFWKNRKMKKNSKCDSVLAPKGTVTFSSFVPERLVFSKGERQ